jgi:hypothetical protein
VPAETPSRRLVEHGLRYDRASVAVDLDQALVADPEVVGDLVQHYVADLSPEKVRIGAGEPFDRPAVDADLVRKGSGIAVSSSGQRDAVVPTEQRLSWWRFVLDDDLDV